MILHLAAGTGLSGAAAIHAAHAVRGFSTSEAAQLGLQASSMGRGGEIFVLDIGASVKIVALASDLNRFYACSKRRSATS
jgi:FlaA1/EpsC-like NDP-sugar epimerase